MKSTQTLIAAAIAGVFAAGTALSTAAPASSHNLPAEEKEGCKGKDGCKGKKKDEAKKEEAKLAYFAAEEKEGCKGKDGCKGKKKDGDKKEEEKKAAIL